MIFEWDEAKNSQNIEKHRIDFNDARLFFATILLDKADTRNDYGEERRIALGWLSETVVLTVYTKRQNAIRIISMGRANKHEREIYFAKQKKENEPNGS